MAAAGCVETVTEVITHANGNVYFNTNQTCRAWCQVNWSAEAAKKAYALLLQAKATSAPVLFQWHAIASCAASANASANSPDYMVLQ